MARDEALFMLILEYADWEPAILAAGLRRGFGLLEPRYIPRVVGLGPEPVLSLGGFRALPDYTLDTAPDDFAALILVGGSGWFGREAAGVLPLVRRAAEIMAVLGGICDGSVFLGVNGFLNEVRHTSNSLSILRTRGGPAYRGGDKYQADSQSVRDGNIVTANGAGFIEFARDVFTALDVAPAPVIDEVYAICKTGFFSPAT